MCKECKKRGKTWHGDDPRCAFDVDGKFKVDMYKLGTNWNCATLNIIRDSIYNDYERKMSYSENQYVGLISYDGMTLALGWYKNKGRTEEFYVFSRMGGLTDLEICERMIKERIL